jgi:excisionase family DNA binding protein
LSVELATIQEAARFLGVSRTKVWQLLKNKVIPFQKDPLDDRKKLVRKSDLEQLKQASANGSN